MEKKIHRLLARLVVVEAELGKPEIAGDQKKYREFAQEYSYLTQVKSQFETLEKLKLELIDAKELLSLEDDSDFIKVLEDEIEALEKKIHESDSKLHSLLIPPDPNDNRNAILEIRAGTGGDEAALFVGDCVRMYKMFADRIGWNFEELSSTPSDMGGYKEFVMVLSGKNVYRYLRYEGGTHRVQRVPETETQGRVHTSAITVCVMLEPEEESDVILDEKELRIDTYRASGAGGQHVNTTDSAVRITHLPTGLVTWCQEERSQHKNKEKAMRLLKAKIADAERERKMSERSGDRAKQVGTGDRSGRIRTYNFPQNRLTDHRINLTKYNLDQVMDGDLEEIVNAVVAHYYHKKINDEND